MTEDNKRPNSNYNLSYPNKGSSGGENLTFYYNREKRLASAPKEVQDMYKEQKQSKFGLFGALVADKPRRALFVIIVLLCAVILLLSRSGFLDKTYVLGENKLDISGFFHEENTIIIIKKTMQKDRAYTGAVDIAVSAPMESADNELNIYSHRIYFSLEKDEMYRFAVPFNEPELLIVLQNDKSEVRHKFKPE